MRAADGFTSMIRCVAGSMTRIPVWTASKRAFRYSSLPVEQVLRFPGGLTDLDSHAVILLALFRKAVWLPAQHGSTGIPQAVHTSPPR